MVGFSITPQEVTTTSLIQQKKGIVTVPHPKKDLKKGTENSILKQAGLK